MGDRLMGEEPEDEEEDCGECKLSAGVIVSHEICKDLKDKNIDCNQLVQDVLDKKISPDQYIDTLIEHTESTGKERDAIILREIRRLMHQ